MSVQTLGILLQPWHQEPLPQGLAELALSGMALDSRLIQPGFLYIALPGAVTHGLHHAVSAAQQGAVAVLAGRGEGVDFADELQSLSIPLIELDDLKAITPALAARFFDDPSRALRVVAVTGTDGKSSVCRFVQQALQRLGLSCGYIGTLGWGLSATLGEPLASAGLTTPDAISLQAMLASMREQGATVVALEASSHGIAEGRLDAVDIEVAVLTNLGRDHLDYHGTLEAYRATKARLFQWPGLCAMLVNGDDALGRALLADPAGPVLRLGFNTQTLRAENIQLVNTGLQFDLIDGDQRWPVVSPLIGRFNIDNLLACHGVLRLLGLAGNDVAHALGRIEPVAGRMERFVGAGSDPVALVDFAHTPQALEAAIAAARQHCRGQLWVVFGCGGDRDPGKRGPMGRAAEAADRIIVTDDNPRTEDPASIRAAIMADLQAPARARNIGNRRAAIETALREATGDDLVLVAGKGHEGYQIVGNERLVFSDRDIVRDLLHGRGAH